MSFPEYNQKAEDHRCAHINNKSFNRIYDRITSLREVSISDAQGMGFERIIRVRYNRSYHCDNNDWGDIQGHRKVLGLITIGKAVTDDDIDHLQQLHNSVRDTYANTLYDTRCLIVNASHVSTPNTPTDRVKEFIVASDGAINGETNKKTLNNINNTNDNDEEFSSFHIAGEDIVENFDLSERLPSCNNEPIPNDAHKNVTCVNMDSSDSSPSCDDIIAQNGKHPLDFNEHSDPLSVPKNAMKLPLNDDADSESANNDETNCVSNYKSQFTQCIRYDNDQQCCDMIDNDIKEFISSLFWVLESKRLDRSHEKQDKVPLLIAPFEKRDLIGLDTDTRTFRKRCLGRMKKHIGDLSLLSGLANEALNHYSASIEMLKTVGDWLWLASAIEGQCVASLVLLYPHFSRRQSIVGLQRNASLPSRHIQRANSSSNNNTFKKGVTGNGNNSKSLPNGLDPILSKSLGKSILMPNEIYDKYKEAACHYAKYRNAAILEFECSFKAARVLTFQEKYLHASEFIQNAVFISFNQTNDEQIERLSVIADLYNDIGYFRKSAFYRRFAALKAVTQNLQNPNWEKCYYLLLPALEGYSLTLDPFEYDRRMLGYDSGWPGIYLQLLQELVTTAMRMNNEPLAVRHLSFLLHTLFNHLSVNQRKEFATKLMSLSSRCGEGSPVPLKLQNGTVIPSVNLTKFPLITSFKVQNLPPHLRPIKLKAKLKSNITVSNPPSPFIFTPLQLNRSNPNTPKKSLSAAQKLDFKWVEGEMCNIHLMVQNILPIELHVNHMAVMTDGVAFETFPTSLSLPQESSPSLVNLSGIPRANGKLDILGYSNHALGVKSDCRLRELPNVKRMKIPNLYTIEVIPPLPLMSYTCTLPKANQFSTLLSADHIIYSASISLYAGEKRQCSITMSNESPNGELIEIINIRVISKLPKDREKLLFQWDDDAINNELPLASGSSFSFDLTINAIGGFVIETSGKKTAPSKYANNSSNSTPFGSHHNSPMHTGGSSATKKSQLLGSTTLANFISDLQTGGGNKHKHNERNNVQSIDHTPSKTIEAILQFEYSGSTGLASGYCRQCALAITIEILPSLVITQWDVLPADQPSHCFLVLDTLNAADQEMELRYATNKEILIESKETCRIPVPIERCPLIDDECCDGESDGESSLSSRCKAHLVNQVSLKWILPATGIKGDASIVNVPWADEMLNSILLSPVQWDVRLNDEQFISENEFTYSCGELISLCISLNNCSGNSLRSLCLWIQCYHDNQNNQRNYRLDMKRAISGYDKVFIEEIGSKQSYVHECGLTFFHTGLYKLDIQCSGIEWCGDASVKHRANVHETERLPLKSSSLWKCSPPIEITIE